MSNTIHRSIHRTSITIARLGDIFVRISESLGGVFFDQCSRIASSMAAFFAAVLLALRPRSWSPPVRALFARQMLFSAVDAIPSALRFATAVGILLIVQVAIWIDQIGVSSEVVTPLLWRVIVREVAPLLACLVVIGRSGIAISAELGTMRVSGEVDVLDSQGLDPMTFLVMPRVLAVMLSVFSLAVVIAVTMVASGYAVGATMDAIRTTWTGFFAELSQNFDLQDMVFFVSKTLIAGGFAGVVCCLEGMSVTGALTDVPRATSRAGIRALTAVFAVSATMSILFYDRFLIFSFG